MLNTGIKGKAEIKVSLEVTADKIGSGNLPVFATPSMVAIMEKAACESILPYLEEGLSTVGSMININHISATPIGMNVRSESELIDIEGKRLIFKVSAYDDTGLIGEGKHERIIIKEDKFLSKALSKKSK